jgi:hypothetical protein
MIDLTIVIYLDDMIEGSGEHQLLIDVRRGDRFFNLLGNTYAVTECFSQTFTKSGFWPSVPEKNKTTIKAMKVVSYEP